MLHRLSHPGSRHGPWSLAGQPLCRRLLGEGASQQTQRRWGLRHFICFEKRPSGLGGKWHHCSALDDRAWSRGCLNGDITAGSWSPVHPGGGKGTGTPTGAPGRREASVNTKRSCTASPNASFHTSRTPLAACVSIVGPSHPQPTLRRHLPRIRPRPVQGHPQEVSLELQSVKWPCLPCSSWKTCPPRRPLPQGNAVTPRAALPEGHGEGAWSPAEHGFALRGPRSDSLARPLPRPALQRHTPGLPSSAHASFICRMGGEQCLQDR